MGDPPKRGFKYCCRKYCCCCCKEEPIRIYPGDSAYDLIEDKEEVPVPPSPPSPSRSPTPSPKPPSMFTQGTITDDIPMADAITGPGHDMATDARIYGVWEKGTKTPDAWDRPLSGESRTDRPLSPVTVETGPVVPAEVDENGVMTFTSYFLLAFNRFRLRVRFFIHLEK